MLHVIEKIKQKLRVEILNGVVTVGLLEKITFEHGLVEVRG